LALASCNGLSTKNHPPLVFALNLSSNSVSLVLAKDDVELAVFANLAPLESRRLVKVPVSDGAFLRHGTGLQPATVEWTDPSGTPYGLKLQEGGLYAVIVDAQGQAALYTLPETFSDEPKLCIVNSSSATLSQIQAAPDWAKNVKVYAQDVVPVVPTEFFSVEPKTLGLYWQTLEQTAKGEHVTAKGPDGKPLRQAFLQGHYYLFLAGEGSVRDLTPNLD
jgi:hypothetical protein